MAVFTALLVTANMSKELFIVSLPSKLPRRGRMFSIVVVICGGDASCTGITMALARNHGHVVLVGI
jgi:hypothetical protein